MPRAVHQAATVHLTGFRNPNLRCGFRRNVQRLPLARTASGNARTAVLGCTAVFKIIESFRVFVQADNHINLVHCN